MYMASKGLQSRKIREPSPATLSDQKKEHNSNQLMYLHHRHWKNTHSSLIFINSWSQLGFTILTARWWSRSHWMVFIFFQASMWRREALSMTLLSCHWKRSCPVQLFHQTCAWICRRLKRCTTAGVHIHPSFRVMTSSHWMWDWVEEISPGTVLLTLRCHSSIWMAVVGWGCCD